MIFIWLIKFRIHFVLILTISAWESIHVNLCYENHDVKPASSPNLNFQQQNKLFMLTIYIRNFSSDATLLFILYVRRYHLRVNVIFSAVIIDNRLFFCVKILLINEAYLDYNYYYTWLCPTVCRSVMLYVRIKDI